MIDNPNGWIEVVGTEDEPGPKRGVLVTRINHGINIVNTEDQSRSKRALYYVRVTSGSFGMEVVWPNYGEYLSFNTWYQAYLRKLANPYLTTGRWMLRVRVPQFRLDRFCVPNGERGPSALFGDELTAVVYTQMLNFESTSDALDVEGDLISTYQSARNDDEDSRYFYPAGVQLRGDLGPSEDDNINIRDRRLL
jgi:hypothetical protein